MICRWSVQSHPRILFRDPLVYWIATVYQCCQVYETSIVSPKIGTSMARRECNLFTKIAHFFLLLTNCGVSCMSFQRPVEIRLFYLFCYSDCPPMALHFPSYIITRPSSYKSTIISCRDEMTLKLASTSDSASVTI
jgi:hypothetical protein